MSHTVLGDAWLKLEMARYEQVQVISRTYLPGAVRPTKEELDASQRAVDEALKAVRSRVNEEPLAELSLLPSSGAFLDASACGRVAPRLRAVMMQLQPAEQGRVGWRERAEEMVAAMEWAAAHPGWGFSVG